MDKMLSDIPKEDAAVKRDAPSQSATPQAVPNNNPSHQPNFNKAFGAYSGVSLPITQKDWDQSTHGQPWYDHWFGRLLTRLGTRGVLGAAAFTVAGLLTRKGMADYNSRAAFSEVLPFTKKGSFSKTVAKTIDVVFGIPIKTTVKFITGSEEIASQAVRFRQTNYRGLISGLDGRTLGNEIVHFTNDFYWMSVMDAMGRDMVAAFDPNVEKPWLDDKGRIKPAELAKSVAKANWRYFSYNGGEDYAVALFYAYWMKAQRHLIDKASPGFKCDFDRGLNGGSLKLGDNPHLAGIHIPKAIGKPGYPTIDHYDKHRPVIVGDFQKEGMVDLQLRFMAYNGGLPMPGTGDFREWYNYFGNKLQGKQDSFYGGIEGEEARRKEGWTRVLGDVVKHRARNFIKFFFTMAPSVPFFWITRTPQSKHRGLFVHPEKGALGYFKEVTEDGKTKFKCEGIHANTLVPPGEDLHYGAYNPKMRMGGHAHDPYSRTSVGTIEQFEPSLSVRSGNNGGRNSFDSYEHGGFQNLGRACYTYSSMLDKPAAWLDKQGGQTGNGIKRLMGIPEDKLKWERFTRPWLHAAVSYFPYMYMKGETALLWDNGRMDVAAEGVVNAIAKRNWKEFKAGAREVGYALMQQPFPEAEREAEAQERLELDSSPPDVFQKTSRQLEREQQDRRLRWQDRIVSGKSPEKPIKGGDGSSLEDTYKIARRTPSVIAEQNKPMELHAEEQELRDALKELTPLTPSVH